MKIKNSCGTRGRPRAFDCDDALLKAMEVFWRKGYEGTTLADLTEAMGINRPSLYSAFGNKEELFRKVLDRYSELSRDFLDEVLEQPTAKQVAATYLHGVAGSAASSCTPGGCLLVQSALVCSTETEPIRQELIARRQAVELLLRQRFERAQSEGDLPGEANPYDLARFVITVQQGVVVQALSGATTDELERVVETALQAWPT